MYRYAYIAPDTTVSVFAHGFKVNQAVVYSAVVYPGTFVGGPHDVPIDPPVGHINFSGTEVTQHVDGTVGRRFVIQNLAGWWSCAVDVLYLGQLIEEPIPWPHIPWPPIRQQASTELIARHKKESPMPTGTVHIWHDLAGEILAIGRPMTETLKCVPVSGNAESTVVVDVDEGQIADLPISHVVDVASRTLVSRSALAGRNQDD